MAQEGGPNRAPGPNVLQAMAASLGGAEAVESIDTTKWASAFLDRDSPISDGEFVNLELELMETALSGDLMGSLRKMLHSFHVLYDLWSDTDVFRTVLEGFPLLSALKGVDKLYEKDKALLTFEDTQEGVRLFGNFIVKAMEAIEGVRDPTRFATKLMEYANSQHPEFKSLVARIEQGDKEANVELQKFIVNRELGDVVDLDKLGFNGIEPEWVKEKRAISMEDEAQFWHKIVDDPVAKRYMEDPGLAYREWADKLENV